MIASVPVLLLILAGALAIVNGVTGKVPLWIPVLFIVIALLVR